LNSPDETKLPCSSRVALITSQAFSINNFRGPLVREMLRRGVEVYALAPDYDDESRAAVTSLGAVPVEYTMSRAGMNPLLDFVDVIKLSIKLSQLQPDMTFAYFIKPVIYGTFAARLAGVAKRFVMIEGAGYVFSDFVRQSFQRRLLRTLVTWLYKISLYRIERVFLLNPDDQRMFVNEGMVPAEKVLLLEGIGLELDYYQVAPPVVQPVCFIMIARLLREKGVYDYIEAASRVKTRHPEVRFLLLGDIDHHPGSVSESEVRAWVDEGVVEWQGHVTDVRIWIAQASVFVLPSYYREGVPRSAQEAMAMGRPVITTDCVGSRETVDEGVNGFLLPARDPEILSQAMLKFVEQPEFILSMGVASRKLAEKKFDVHRTNARILASMGLDKRE
jgi:glycosyltransferase involved in cell wall biosynthesis